VIGHEKCKLTCSAGSTDEESVEKLCKIFAKCYTGRKIIWDSKFLMPMRLNCLMRTLTDKPI
jgi:hypothetical protein